MIMKCSCTHGTQDQFHGKGNRVHNLCKGNTKARCTVCGTEKSLTTEQIKQLKRDDE